MYPVVMNKMIDITETNIENMIIPLSMFRISTEAEYRVRSLPELSKAPSIEIRLNIVLIKNISTNKGSTLNNMAKMNEPPTLVRNSFIPAEMVLIDSLTAPPTTGMKFTAANFTARIDRESFDAPSND